MLLFGSLSSLVVRSCRNRAYLNLAAPALSNRKLALPKSTLHRTKSTMSTSPVDSDYIGQSGRIYKIKQVIQQEETNPPRRVYLAT